MRANAEVTMTRSFVLFPVSLLVCSCLLAGCGDKDDEATDGTPGTDGTDGTGADGTGADGTGSDGTGSDGTAAPPDAELSASRIAFGDIDLGDPDGRPSETVTLTNTGGSDLDVSEVFFEEDDHFALAELADTTVSPGGSLDLTVTFDPDAIGPQEDVLTLAVNDPDEPELQVALSGSSSGPRVEVSPNTLDFGTVLIGCEDVQIVEVRNTGDRPLEVRDLEYNAPGGGELALDTEEIPTLPVSIDAGSSLELPIRYAPVDSIPDFGTLRLETNDILTRDQSGTQEGEGGWETESESFTADGGTTFPLSTVPADPGSVSVSVDGSVLRGGWSYDSGANAVEVDIPPAVGAAVVVDYGVQGTCDG